MQLLTKAGVVSVLLGIGCVIGSQGAANVTEASSTVTGSGLSVSSEVYSNNLKHLKDNVLPKGWQLNAVQKWDAYGHGIKALAGAAAKLGVSISVLTNQEAREVLAAAQAAGISRPGILRIVPADGPAKYAEVLEAARAGLGVQETMTPLNQQDILEAARVSGKVIPVHIYLYSPYENPYGYNLTTSKQLTDLLNLLDTRRVKVVGIMTHNGGLTAQEALARVDQFNKVVCPVAKALAARQPILLHFASSDDVFNLLPGNATRMHPPAGLCSGPNITWAARVGDMTYGGDADYIKKVGGGLAGVMTWYADVSSVSSEAGPDGAPQQLATVDLSPTGVRAFIPESPDITNTTAAIAAGVANGYQPDSFVFIKDKQYRLAKISTEGSQIVIDVGNATAGSVAVGDRVCIICPQHLLGALAQEVGADGYNTALCLMGRQPVVGSMEEMPACAPAANAAAQSQAVRGL